ncbi:thiamine pyrophosphate-binding protein [Anaerotignum lactatifermentans]|uniref:Acetolactate synthase, large subunit n=2 Tax=Anaerotignum lactatifermentans TaxID=160404 RepID=A0A1M6ZKA8_9FIRM|nr:thiamine pyrophosphate-binding protein [Anaerotignum lactatifermentans]SHL30958.1 acetolactate synthase, large subunit [[Clostridium] lactatifermentans DSM 14214] [Anaerotignum lactatifermentans DSM 14214]
MNMTGAQSMVRCLEEEDVSHIFGYPGATICPFYEALYHSESIQHILVRQEQSAAHMASGYARITGKAGVCVVTSGPGATNLITGIATAYMDSIPLVAITGQVQSYLLGRDIFQEVDITGAVSPFIKHTYLIKKAEDIPRIFKEAFHIATTGRPGPVLIDVPIDMQEAEIDFSYPEEVNIRGYKPTINGNLKQLKKVVKTIAAAERPLICVGGGAFCAKAQEQVRQLCEETKIPMVTTMMGLGVLPTSHPLNIGMIGSFGHKTANMALSQTDLLILVGARVGDRAITAPEKISSQSKTIHIDIDPAEIGKNVNPTVPLVGDLRAVLESLLAEHPISNCSHWSEYLQQEAAAEKATMPDPRPDTIQPKRLMAEIGKQITADACVVADVGQNQIWAAKYLSMRQGRFLTTGGLGTMDMLCLLLLG